ncbi:hypothetical protein AB0H07_01630 [Streptomyces sp. NPDC021354]
MKASTRTTVLRCLGNRRGQRRLGALTTVLFAGTLQLLNPTGAAAATGAYSSFGVADWDRDQHQDIIARNNATGDLWLYPGNSQRGYSNQTPVKIGNGW